LIEDNPDIFVSWLFAKDLTDLTVDTSRSHFLRTGHDTDLIIYPPGVNLAAAAAGLTGTAEGYETTLEGITQAASVIDGKGVLSFTGWNQHPPTGRLKTLNLLWQIPAFNPEGRFDGRVFTITGWSTHTFIAKLEPLTPDEIKRLETFCNDRGFKLLDGDRLFEELLSEEPAERDHWNRDLDLRPPTDLRPYPWHSLRISYMRHILGKGREAAFARVEWGFFFLVMVFLVSTAFTAFALLLSRPSRKTGPGSPFSLYFACLGVGYMSLEIAFIKRCLLVAGPPAFTSGLVLVSFLLGSGLGSHLAGRLNRRTSLHLFMFLAIPAVASASFLLVPQFLKLPGYGRSAAIILAALPPAFLMGFPFPSALALCAGERETVVPWAWALTGYTSVMGSSISGVLAVTHGLAALFILGSSCYLLAGLLFIRMIRKPGVS
jgi:hypothetical protein